jgi:hypothetical protein
VDNKWIPDNEIELTWQQSVGLFVAESTAFYLNGAWTIGNEITGAGAAPDLKDNVQFAPFPAVGENGVKVDLAQVSGVDPLLMAFLDVQTQAKTVYGLPDTKAMQQRGWDDSWSGLQTLMAGKSAEEALEAFLTEMSAYTG